MTDLHQHQFRERVLSFIRQEELIHSGDHILVAVSGGPDSVALCDLMAFLGERLELSQITVLHFDHQLRGQASNQDRLFVQSLAARYGFPFHYQIQDADAYRHIRGVSLEMAARASRHSFFQSAREQLKADKIALGHNANDQAEEILLRLLRGTGPSGLAGMLPKTANGIIRPLLFATRKELLRYLLDRQLDFREDATNLQTFYQRNALRIEVFPTLEKHFHARVAENLCRHSELARSEEEYWSLQVLGQWAAVSIEEDPSHLALSIPGLLLLHTALRKRMLRFSIERLQGHLQGIYQVHIELLCGLIAKEGTEKTAHLPGKLRAQKRGDTLILSRAPIAASDVNNISPAALPIEIIPGPGRFSLPQFRMNLRITQKERLDRFEPVTARADAALLDAEKIGWPMTVRSWIPGDRFRPLGLQGSKKLQDFFTDLRIPKAERASIPLLCDRDKICWIMGYRLDDRVKVTSDTRLVLLVERESSG